MRPAGEAPLGVTADRVSGNGDRLDGVVGIDDEGCAVCNAVLVQDAQCANQLTLEVGCHDDGQVQELFVGAAPCVVGVLVVNGNTDHLGVACLELVSELAECCKSRWGKRKVKSFGQKKTTRQVSSSRPSEETVVK